VSHQNAEIAACPDIDPADAEDYAQLAVEDALDLIVELRDLDPRQVYGRLVRWGREQPARLVTACFALAAMHHPDTPAAQLEMNVRSAAVLQGVQGKDTAA
jgi:hypothetical protein